MIFDCPHIRQFLNRETVESSREVRRLRILVLASVIISIGLLAIAGASSLASGNTVLLWYFLAFILPFEFFLLGIYFYRLHIQTRKEAELTLRAMEDLLHSSLISISMAIDAKEQTEYGNITKVRDVALILADEILDKKPSDRDGLAVAAVVHDLGKLAVPERILNKPGGLTEDEISIMRRHAEIGAEILKTIPFPDHICLAVQHHHERWDGTGYPSRLAGKNIPLEARILAIADGYVSLRSARPFRAPLDQEHAARIIIDGAGQAYDPELVKIFENSYAAIEKIISRTESKNQLRVVEKVKKGFDSRGYLSHSGPANLFKQISIPHKEMQAEFEITRNMAKTISLKETLGIVATWIKRFVPYTTCVIYRFDRERQHIKVHHVSGKYEIQMSNLTTATGEGISGKVAANLRPIFGIDPEPDFPSGRGIDGLKDCLVVPLMFIDESTGPHASENPTLIGVISLYSEFSNFYSRQDLGLMTTIAENAARGIHNSIIHDETREDAYTDSLTGLPNIRFFNASIENELHRAQRLNYPINFLMMDLDNFKMVNDIYGHKEGDRILIEISNLLREQFRKSDICIRYGGDEFMAMLPGVGTDIIEHTMQRIEKVFNQNRFKAVNGDLLNIGISIGSSSFPKDGSDPETLLEIADRNMYKNKKQKKAGQPDPESHTIIEA